jgi:hypothetical protein
MITGGTLFLAQGIEPESLGSIALGAQVSLGAIGLLLALAGILFAMGEASIDTLFSGAYNGIAGQASASSARVRDSDVVPWEAIVRLDGDRIVVRDEAAPDD